MWTAYIASAVKWAREEEWGRVDGDNALEYFRTVWGMTAEQARYALEIFMKMD